VWLDGSRHRLQSRPNFRRLIRNLHDARTWTDTLLELQVLDRFATSGFEIGIYPVVSVNGKPKTPDAELVDLRSETAFYLEVSQLHSSRAEQKSWQCFHRITQVCLEAPVGLEHCGAILKDLSSPHVQDVVLNLRNVVQEAHETQSFRSYAEDDAVEIAIAPRGDHLLQQWAEERGLKPGELRGIGMTQTRS